MLKKQDDSTNGHFEVMLDQQDGEVEIREDENGDSESRNECRQLEEELHKLREEDDTLRCQVEALKNEIIELYSNHQEELQRKNSVIAELTALKDCIDKSKKALLNLSQKRAENEREAKANESSAIKKRKLNGKGLMHENNDMDKGTVASASSCNASLEKEAHLISLISIYLHVLPFGANTDNICHYLHQMDSTITTESVENLLKRYPSMFKQNSTHMGGSFDNNWCFISFQK